MKNEIIPFRSFGNDLFADKYCTCGHKDYKGTPLEKIMKTKLSLSGYADAYFFDVVNKNPVPYICDCGMSYLIQWKHDGVSVETIGKLTKV